MSNDILGGGFGENKPKETGSIEQQKVFKGNTTKSQNFPRLMFGLIAPPIVFILDFLAGFPGLNDIGNDLIRLVYVALFVISVVYYYKRSK